jgi:hypothetical protein
MDKRWKDAIEQGTIGGMPLLKGTPCMLLVAKRLTDGEIITQVQPRRGSSPMSTGGSTLHHHTKQDIATEKMQQWMRQNK